MSTVLHGVAVLGDWIIGPLARLQPWVAMAVVSLVTSVVVLIVYKYTSNQEAMVRVKDRIKGSFLAISLYRDSLRVIGLSSLRITRDNFHYMALNLVPLAVMILPVSLVMVQLDGWYGYRALRVGEDVLVTAVLDGREVMDPGLELELPRGLELDAPVVRVPAQGEVSFRVKAVEPGDHRVALRVGDTVVEKHLPVGAGERRISPVRHAGGVVNAFFYPGEPPIRTGGVQSVRVDFQGAEMSLLGLKMHWLWAFFVLTLVFAFALRGPFKVTF